MAVQNGQGKITSKWWFWVIIVAWVFIVGGIYNATKEDTEGEMAEIAKNSDSESDGIKDDKDGASSDANLDQNASSTYVSTYYLGMPFTKDGLRTTITSVERNYQPQYATPKDGQEFVKVNISFENVVKISRNYNAFYWKIENSNGDITDYSEAMLAQADDSLNSGELAPGGTKTASLVFSVPADDKELKLHYNSDVLSDKDMAVIILEDMLSD